MGCDLCGREGQLYEIRIEGTIMTVCDRCKEHGEVIKRIPTFQEEKKAQREPVRREPTHNEILLLVRNDYGPVIKRAREQRGKKQEELAKQLRIKESQLHKYESGTKKPDLETARMLERALGVKLVEEHLEEGGVSGPTNAGPMTIADLLRQ